MAADLILRASIAEGLLGVPLDDGGFAPCPGSHLHNGKTGRRDFRVILEGAPSGSCFHTSCGAVVEDFNFKLRSAIGRAESPGGGGSHISPYGSVAPMPLPLRKLKRPAFNPAKLAAFAASCPFPIDEAWLAARSPVAIPEIQDSSTALLFLAALYQPTERVLIFTNCFTQGDYLWAGDRGTFRLGELPGVRAVESPLPQGGPLGVWALAQPVTGKWLQNPGNRDKETGAPKMGRRHGLCVTDWRFLVLESDTASAELWLRALVQFPLPIVAIYTSGGRSIHALARVNASCKEEWDAMRDELVPIVCVLGADAAALTAVRLTRLPGMWRHGTRDGEGRVRAYPAPRMQRLLYLHPAAPARCILDL